MKKYFCDACSDEVKYPSSTIAVPVHIVRGGLGKYVDSSGNSISCRADNFELCARCTNDVYGYAYSRIKAIKKPLHKE